MTYCRKLTSTLQSKLCQAKQMVTSVKQIDIPFVYYQRSTVDRQCRCSCTNDNGAEQTWCNPPPCVVLRYTTLSNSFTPKDENTRLGIVFRLRIMTSTNDSNRLIWCLIKGRRTTDLATRLPLHHFGVYCCTTFCKNCIPELDANCNCV